MNIIRAARLALLVAATAAVPLDGFATNASPEGPRGLRMSRNYGWNRLSANAFVLWAGVEEPYRVTVLAPCPDLLIADPSGLTAHRRRITPGIDHGALDSTAVGIDDDAGEALLLGRELELDPLALTVAELETVGSGEAHGPQRVAQAQGIAAGLDAGGAEAAVGSDGDGVHRRPGAPRTIDALGLVDSREHDLEGRGVRGPETAELTDEAGGRSQRDLDLGPDLGPCPIDHDLAVAEALMLGDQGQLTEGQRTDAEAAVPIGLGHAERVHHRVAHVVHGQALGAHAHAHLDPFGSR